MKFFMYMLAPTGEALSMQVDKITHQLMAASICHQPLQCWHNTEEQYRRATGAGIEATWGPLAWTPINQSFSSYCCYQMANIPATESDTESSVWCHTSRKPTRHSGKLLGHLLP